MRLPPTSSGEPCRDDARAYSSPPLAGRRFLPVFAMWFASGIVMHFVPFPALEHAARFAGLAPIDLAALAHGPADAVGAERHQGRDARAFVATARWSGLSGIGGVREWLLSMPPTLSDGAVRPASQWRLRSRRTTRDVGIGFAAAQFDIDVLRSVDGVERVRSVTVRCFGSRSTTVSAPRSMFHPATGEDRAG